MQDRDEELSEFFKRGVKLLRVHSLVPSTGLCSCGNVNCDQIGKHPKGKRGVWDAKVYTCAEEIGHCNIGVACGETVVVLDIDPRNGGDQTITALQKAHGSLPKTWICETGGGGQHYYFAPTRSHHRSGNSLKHLGVELKGVGSYVLAPTSLHASGRWYEWDVSPLDCELAPLPAWIEEVCCPKAIANDSYTGTKDLEYYLESDVHDALKFIPSDLPYHDWIRVGMALKSTGFSFEVWDHWSSTAANYPGSEKLQRKWNSFGGGAAGIATVFYLAREHGWEPAEVECLLIPNQRKEEVSTEEVADTIASSNSVEMITSRKEPHSFPPGIAGTLAETIEVTALHSHRSFAIASALSILSALCQGSYCSPYRQGYLGAYTLLIAGASAGKEHYSSRVTSVIRKVCPRLIMGVPQSPQALRSDLYECNSRVITMDEGLRWLQGQSESKSQLDKNLVSDIMSIWGMSAPLLPGLATKKKEDRSPEIEWPHLTIMGCGTTEKLESLLRISPAFVEDGTLSRFDFILSDYAESKGFLGRPEWGLDAHLEQHLRAICQTGRHTDEINPVAETKIDRYVYGQPTPVRWDDEVSSLWNTTAMTWIAKAQTEDRLAASVWNRAAEKALRVAAVLAVADSPVNPVIRVEHMEWALSWQATVADSVATLVCEKVGQSDQQLAEQIILGKLFEAREITLGKIMNRCRPLKRVPFQTVRAAIDSLAAQGILQIEQGPSRGLKVQTSIKLRLLATLAD